MTDFVDPIVIAQINGAKDELIAEVAKITQNSDTIQDYVDNLPPSSIGEAPSDGKTYGRKDKAWVEVITGGGGSGDATWGSITGTLSDQTDLQNALNDKADQSALANKANTADLAAVATSGKYSDLSGKPTILPDAPADGEQYVRINNAWAKVEAELAADPTLLGTVTVKDGSNKLIIEQDSSYVYFSRPSPFSGQYYFRFRVGNTGLEFSTDTNGTVWNPVGGGASDPTNLGNTKTSTSVTITSSTGNDTTVSGASEFSAGVMTAADKSKLDDLENFSGIYTGNLTIRENVDSYTVLVPTADADTTYETQFQAWSTNSPWGSAEHQYDVTFKADGVYHQDVAGSGAERRLVFADELGGGGASTFTDLTDTPADYTGATAGQLVAVNATTDGLEFVDAPTDGGSSFDPTMQNTSASSFINVSGYKVSGTDYYVSSSNLFPFKNTQASIRLNLYTAWGGTIVTEDDTNTNTVRIGYQTAHPPISELETEGWSVGDTVKIGIRWRSNSRMWTKLRHRITAGGVYQSNTEIIDFLQLVDLYGNPIADGTARLITITYELQNHFGKGVFVPVNINSGYGL